VSKKQQTTPTSSKTNHQNNFVKSSIVNIEPPTKHQTPHSNIAGPRGWMDRFTDYLLGEEESSLRYALICSKCFAHNGLSLIPKIPFSCKNCHFLNNPPEQSALNLSGADKMEERMKKNLGADVDATPLAEPKHLRREKNQQI
jgi:hypothetical protein